MKPALLMTLLLAGILACQEGKKTQNNFMVNHRVTQFQDSLIIFNLEDLQQQSLESIDILVNDTINAINIKMALDPATDDASKKEFIDGVKAAVKKLGAAKSASNIKAVSFDIGEQIFLTQSQVDSVAGDYEKMAEVNLRNAWAELSPILVQNFPQAKFSALNWGW